MTGESESGGSFENLAQVGAVFDLDGTLLPDTSAEIEFIKFAVATGELSVTRFLLRFLCWSVRLHSRGVEGNKRHFKGLSEAWLKNLGVHFCQMLAHRIPDSALDEMAEHRKQGNRVGIVSGAPEILIEGLKRRLDLDFVVGTQLEMRAERRLDPSSVIIFQGL